MRKPVTVELSHSKPGAAAARHPRPTQHYCDSDSDGYTDTDTDTDTDANSDTGVRTMSLWHQTAVSRRLPSNQVVVMRPIWQLTQSHMGEMAAGGETAAG